MISFKILHQTNSAQKINKNKTWVTKAIKVSIIRKRQLSRLVKDSSDEDFINYVKKYRKVLTKMCNESTEIPTINL